MRSRKPEQTFSQVLSAGALTFTTTTPNDKPFRLDWVYLHFSQAVSETITITMDSKNGANYDTVLQEVVLVNETDYVFRPQGRSEFDSGDEIKVQCTNVGLAGTVRGAVKTSEVS